MAEVLITLAIIGVVAALTIPTVVKNYQEQQFKTAYKKAYSDLSRVVNLAIASGEMPYRSSAYADGVVTKEWELFKRYLKVQKSCDNNNNADCWKPGDTFCWGTCSGGDNPDTPGFPGSRQPAFIDSAGRSWSQYYSWESKYFVDTNGFKEPNKFGKDRWVFVVVYQNGLSGMPIKLSIYSGDILVKGGFCAYPPCYYKKWLME